MGNGWLEPLRSQRGLWREAALAVGLEGFGELTDLPPLAGLGLSLYKWVVDRQGEANLWAYLETMNAMDHDRFGILESSVAELDREVEGLIARGGRRAIDAESQRLAALLGAIVADGVAVGCESGRYESAHLLLDVVGTLHEAELEVLVALETPRSDPVADQRIASLLDGTPRMTKGALSTSDLSRLLPELALVVTPAIKRLEGRGLVRDVLANTMDGGDLAAAQDPDDPGSRWSATAAGRELLSYLAELRRVEE